MSMDDVVGWLQAVEWVYLVRVLWPTGLMLAVGLFLFRAEKRKALEAARFLAEGQEVLRKITVEHEQASWLLGRMKEKIEERRRAKSLEDCELQLDRIIREDSEEQAMVIEGTTTLDEILKKHRQGFQMTVEEAGAELARAREVLTGPLLEKPRRRMVEVVDTATGTAYIVPKESSKKLEGFRRAHPTPQELEEWKKKVQSGEEIPF